MVKLICFLKRNPALGVQEFHRHWRERHAPIITGTPGIADRIVRYEQNHRPLDDYDQPGRADFDGVAIQWFASADDFAAMIAEPGYWERVAPDEDVLLDRSGLVWILTEAEEPVIPGPDRREGLTKVHTLLRRSAETPREAFHRHWREVHGPLFRDTRELARHVVRYEQNHRTTADYDRPDGPELDGVAIQWFEAPDDFLAMAGEPVLADTIGADNERFLDTGALAWLLTDNEEVMIG